MEGMHLPVNPEMNRPPKTAREQGLTRVMGRYLDSMLTRADSGEDPEFTREVYLNVLMRSAGILKQHRPRLRKSLNCMNTLNPISGVGAYGSV